MAGLVTEAEFLALAASTNVPTRCANCHCSLYRQNKSWSLCDGCFDQSRAADDAARRLAGRPSRQEEKRRAFGQRYGR